MYETHTIAINHLRLWFTRKYFPCHIHEQVFQDWIHVSV